LRIQPIFFNVTTSNIQNQPTFQYSNKIKTLFKEGLLPSVKVDVAGNKLTKKNVTLDHIIPKSKGGKSCLSNYMLAEKKFNWDRGNTPLKEWITPEGIVRYLNQFIGVKIRGFNGDEYIKEVLKTLDKANEMGV
jgi:hypothetical protein